jgi:hypothetical protein
MPIPTRADFQLAEIETAGSGILTQLRTMQHAAARDVPDMRSRLRDMLRAYVDAAMTAAPDGR